VLRCVVVWYVLSCVCGLCCVVLEFGCVMLCGVIRLCVVVYHCVIWRDVSGRFVLWCYVSCHDAVRWCILWQCVVLCDIIVRCVVLCYVALLHYAVLGCVLLYMFTSLRGVALRCVVLACMLCCVVMYCVVSVCVALLRDVL